MGTDFRREVDETYALLSYYAASSGNSLQTFRDNLSVPLNLEDGADRLSLMVHYSLCNDPEERSSHRYRRFAGTSYFLFQNIFSLVVFSSTNLQRGSSEILTATRVNCPSLYSAGLYVNIL